jgi:hypothetical protein
VAEGSQLALPREATSGRGWLGDKLGGTKTSPAELKGSFKSPQDGLLPVIQVEIYIIFNLTCSALEILAWSDQAWARPGDLGSNPDSVPSRVFSRPIK